MSKEMEAFESALARGDTDFCMSMLDKNPQLAKRVEKDRFDNKQTPLMLAMRGGNVQVVERVLELGAKMNIVHGDGHDRQTAMTMVMDHGFGDRIPNQSQIRDVLVKHYGQRQEAAKEGNLLGGLKAKAGEMFKSFVEKMDDLVKAEAIGMAGLSAPAAAIGSVVGLSAAGAVIAPATNALAIGGATAGVGVFVLHKIRDSMDSEFSGEVKHAEATFKAMAKAHTPVSQFHAEQMDKVNAMPPAEKEKVMGKDIVSSMSMKEIDETMSLISEINAENFAKSIRAPIKALDANKGRYSGRVLFESENHVVQDVGRGEVAIHEKSKFAGQDQEQFKVGQMMRVEYKDGHGQVANTQNKSKDTGLSR